MKHDDSPLESFRVVEKTEDPPRKPWPKRKQVSIDVYRKRPTKPDTELE